MGANGLLDAARSWFPHIKIQTIDWATIPFKEQLQITRDTDILVGVTGAGLTQTMFLKEGNAAVIEIQTGKYNFNGFRGMAIEMNLNYFKAHASILGDGEQDWHVEDLSLEEDRFLDLVDHAVASLYNRPGRSFDLN